MVRPVAVLVGPPASGKSTVMRHLSRRLGVDGRDTDADVEAASGVTVAAIFADQGESAFRALERDAVAAALESHPGVLSLGGGAVLDPATRERLAAYAAEGGVVVFLDVSRLHAARRLRGDRSRPLLAGDAVARWDELMTARRPVYEEVATVRVRTDAAGPGHVVEEIVRHIERAHVSPRTEEDV
ncbi:shikimate kinase [Luteimicrobium sp. DT211]|uniref:shikimate kinase n=1 Tax=Luteimicrobium sp. DT211 TaxID=3393412 RepID=UPI003CED80CA